MVRMEFPAELLSPTFLDALIRESKEDFVIKKRVESAQAPESPLRPFFEPAYGYGGYGGYGGGFKGGEKPIQSFFDSLGLEEKETLNGVAVAGQCQFSCLADQLFGRDVRGDWRADIFLRRLALYVIATNEEEFRSFMLHANPKTRRQNQTAGESVDVEGYLRKMADNATDGDHLTLQALCDALQCPVHVVQLVDSPLADKMLAHVGQRTIVVVNELAPRLLPHLHPRIHRLQVQRRELWLTLRGEAHFRSLHCVRTRPEEDALATAQLRALQEAKPDPPPTPANTTAAAASGGAAAASGSISSASSTTGGAGSSDAGSSSRSSCSASLKDEIEGITAVATAPDAASPAPTAVATCTICLNEVLVRSPPQPPAVEGKQDEKEEGVGRVTRSTRASTGGGNGKGKAAPPPPPPAAAEAEGGEEEEDDDEEEQAAVRPNSCQHTFHLACLRAWVRVANACPNCKALIQTMELVSGQCVPIPVTRRGQRTAYNRLLDDQRIGPEDYVDGVDYDDEEEAEPEDDIRCYVCGHANHARVLLLCDGEGCSQAAHTFCLGLPRVPDGAWFCRDCAPPATATSASSTRRRRQSVAEGAASSSGGSGSAGRLLHRRRGRSLGGLGDEEEVIVIEESSAAAAAASSSARAQQTPRRSGGANTLARELQRRHGTGVLPSTAPWGRVLSAAQRAERSLGGMDARPPPQAASAATTIPIGGPAAAAGGGGGDGAADAEARRAFAQRERELARLQQQGGGQGGRRRSGSIGGAGAGGGGAVGVASSAAAGGSRKRPSPTRAVYEISSSSDEEEEAKAVPASAAFTGPVTRRRSGSIGSLGDLSAEGAATAAAAATPAPPPAGAGGGAGGRQHIRPQVQKRPRISITDGGGSSGGASVPVVAVANGCGGGGGDGGDGGPDVRALLATLYAAASADAASIEKGWPPQEMVRVTPKLSAVFTWDQRDQARLLNAGLLRVLKRFLDPPVRTLPGGKQRRARPGQYTPAHTKAAILKLLQVLPVGLVHLQEAKLGPVLLAAYTGGSPEDEALARMLVGNWARFVDTVQRNGIPPSRTRQHGQGWRSPSSNNNNAAASASSSSASAAAASSYPRAPVAGSNGGPQYVPVSDPERLFPSSSSRNGGGRRGSGGGGGFSLQVFGSGR